MVSDARERQAALDPARSFIVQAPAGSGKTELLVQRYLRLLKTVEHPESIVAITFTRKAAAEMRARVLDTLHKAASEPKPEPEHERQTWLLAWEARKRDQSTDWRLEENPSRLRIQTIDSFCHSLTRRMPWLSRFGAPPETAEDASDLYRDAARRTMEGLERDEGWSGAIEKLLQHLDNDLPKVEGLIVGMLPRRDQWLRHIMDKPDRAELERSLENAIRDGLRRAEASLPETLRARVFQLAAHAARNLRKDNFSSPIVNCEVAGADGFWLGIAELLLTKTGTLRKKVDKNTGFPAGDKRKPEMVALIEEMDLDPEPLADVRALPARSYSEEQWEVLEALFQLLKLASAQLRIVFRERRQTDFCEVAQGALLALGTDEQPTDLAYALDFRLQHLLVDEFQDTSYSQFQLLERLTAGWEPGDGRTLFLVGDPMQSIYRFREAEVGLFLRARAGGIGGLPLVPLTLKVNFRSQRPIVEWVNDAFDKALPVLEDAATGAVVYSPSEAHRADVPGAGVEVHAFATDDREAEAEQVVNLIQAARAAEPRQKIAILVRARTHAPHIVDRLKREGIRFLAAEMDPMSSRPMVGDLWALTRALLHPADRIAWLAVLRAPWCGLNLDDLLTLVENDAETPLWDLMHDAGRVARLSAGGRRRLERLLAALDPVLAGRYRMPVRIWVESAWIELGGPACARDAADMEDAEAFFSLLERFEQSGDIVDLAGIEEEIGSLFAPPDPEADDSLQILTMHKAKGLEFDTVILPGLGRRPRHDEARLLNWLEYPRDGSIDLLLAPIKKAGQKEEAIADYLRLLEKRKQDYEIGRLLYVAATRARKRLHLLGHVGEKGVPHSGSLLDRLWESVAVHFEGLETPPELSEPETARPPAITLRRLPLDWTLPAPPPAVRYAALTTPVEEKAVTFEWVGSTLRHVGTVVHHALERIGHDGWNELLLRNVETELASLGVPPAEIPDAAWRVREAVRGTQSDPRGRWILSPHQEARTEYAISGVLGDDVVNVIIDRTFVDEQGVRWIIDYKTSSHEGAGVDAFLDNEQLRYQDQLERYGALLSRLEGRPVRLGLYFPLLGGWREWALKEGATGASGR